MDNLNTLSQQSVDTSTAINQDAPSARTTRLNPPGLTTLRYQGGEYLSTVQRMLAQLTSSDALARLNPDAYDDWSIALVHAWAVVTDVLTFYQERLINEGYLGTATERRSILELARAIGYELSPGLVAQTDLALTVAAADEGQPEPFTVPKGSAVQSTPKEGELPQIFETSHDQTVRTEWNLLRPYLDLNPSATTVTSPLPINEPSIRVAGTRSDLAVGAYILIVDQPPATAESTTATSSEQPPAPSMETATTATDEQPKPAPVPWLLGELTSIESDPQKPYSLITWKRLDSCGEIIYRPAIYLFRQETKLFGYAQGAIYFDQEVKPLPPTAKVEITTSATTPTPSATAQVLPLATTAAGAAEAATPDKVARWEPRTYSLPNTDINTCVVNAQGWIFVGTKHDVYRSTDNGENWTAVGVDLIRRNVTALALLDPLLFAGTSTGGIYLSYDNGDNWTPISGDVVAPDVTVKKDSNENFQVEYTEVLPKVPVNELAAEQKGKAITLYAATAKGLFASEDGGKSWHPKSDLPTLTNRPTAAAQRAELVKAAEALIRNQALGWLAGSLTVIAKGAGTLKWLGLDLWDFLRARIQSTPSTQAITALALVPTGSSSTLVVGTETGKFDLKPGPRRWLIVAAILLLILLQQFLFNRNQANTLPIDFDAAGTLSMLNVSVTPSTPITATITATTTVTVTESSPQFGKVAAVTLGTLEITPTVKITEPIHFALSLQGNPALAATVNLPARQVVLTGDLASVGKLNQSASRPSAQRLMLEAALHGMSTLTVTGLLTESLQAISATGAASTQIALHATALLTPGQPLWPPTLSIDNASFGGTIEPTTLKDDSIAWLQPILGGSQELFQKTIIPGWQAVKSFAIELWAALPPSVQKLLVPLYTKLIAPVVLFIDIYLVRPLLNHTAATLVQASGLILAVIALLLAWQYTARRMSERKTVRLNEPVYTLVVRDNKQLFVGTDSGVYRSLEDDPDLPIYQRTARLLLYQLFKDKEMEPINNGLLLTKDGQVPPDDSVPPDAKVVQVRTLIINNTGALLLGTADGKVFRSDTNGDHWYLYSGGLIPKPAELAVNTPSVSVLKGAKTIVSTKQGQLLAGAVGTNPVEDQWFTNHAGVPPAKQDEAYSGVVDLATNDVSVTTPSWLLLRRAEGNGFRFTHYSISKIDKIISRDFVTPGVYQRLTVSQQATAPLTNYPRSQATAFVGSELVPLFDNTPVAGQQIRLDRYVPGLTGGQRLIIRGQRLRGLICSADLVLWAKDKLATYPLHSDEIVQVLVGPPLYQEGSTLLTKEQLTKPHPWQLATRTGFIGTVEATLAQIRWIAPAVDDPIVSEVFTIDYVDEGLTASTLFLKKDLAYVYDRATVNIFGNIVPVTHGETIADEVLGSGSGTQAFECFALQEQPLTYLSAPTTAGFASTLEVKVNRIAWAEVPYLYGLPRDRRAYITRQDAAGATTITFGDGKQGARLPTGTEQITATYRIGSGTVGNVPADTINQLQNLPDRVSAATNPLPAVGGLPAEASAMARRQAPRMVRIMGRIVALTDYADFAQQFPGIGRAQRQKPADGKQQVLVLTIADREGNEVPSGSPLITNLQQAIEANRAVTVPVVQIESYQPRYFTVTATLRIEPDHAARSTEIKEDARQRLIAYFAFDQRDFGQHVTLAEVTTQLQAVTGVVAVVDATIAFQDEGTDSSAHATPHPPELQAKPNELLKVNAVTGITLQCEPIATGPTQGALRRSAR